MQIKILLLSLLICSCSNYIKLNKSVPANFEFEEKKSLNRLSTSGILLTLVKINSDKKFLNLCYSFKLVYYGILKRSPYGL
jgi:hypothetical protein